jgi:hypothetical protein
LEAQLSNYICALRLAKNGRAVPENEIIALQDRINSGTLGRNLAEVRELLGGDWPLADEMAEVLERRNFLAHHWWRVRILSMGTETKRAALINELQALQERFQSADAKLTERSMALHSDVGIKPDTIRAEFQRLLRQSSSDDPADADSAK